MRCILLNSSYYPLFFKLGTVNNRKVIDVFIYTDTWRKDRRAQDIEEAINCAAPGKIRIVSVTKVAPSLVISQLIVKIYEF